jgi:hypothetical protein
MVLFLAFGVFLGCGDSGSMHEKPKTAPKQNTVEAYQLSNTIPFSHTVHGGELGIDCKYCHNSVTQSKKAGLPTVNVCMNCHKKIPGKNEASRQKIQELYEAAGWDGDQFTGKTKPVVWNKMHRLPDSVFIENAASENRTLSSSFSHVKHVEAGSVDCKSCHGNLKQGEVSTIKFDEGFCAKCHY